MTENRQYKCLLISDFTIDNLAAYLGGESSPPKIIPLIAPFNQVIRVLLDDSLECWKQNPDLAVIWTQPGAVIPSFNRIIRYESISEDRILQEVDEFSAHLLTIGNRLKYVFVPTWALPSHPRGSGLLDTKSGIGIGNTLMRMNLRLADNLRETSNIYLLNAQNWMNAAGEDAFSPKLWYMGKIAFGNIVFQRAAEEIRAALRGITGKARKLIILDLDDTLWGGIVGDLGWEKIILGGHDPIGEAYIDFQRGLKALTNRGILLGIVSKNEETTAIEAINKHTEMFLTLNDFAGWKINWKDKAQNIIDLVAELNLGLDSAVFIDDNPVERSRVKTTLPEVLVPEWPKDPIFYKQTLLGLRCFDAPSISREDSSRTKMYASERKRRTMEVNLGSMEEWLQSLEITVKVERLSKGNLPRTTQLLNKTNQMNLSTRRMTEPELYTWAKKPGHELWTFRVSDKFGDSGLTGIISLKSENDRGKIVDFVLSCRVMGRGVEETMLHAVITRARALDLNQLFAEFIPTDRNQPCLEFWKKSGFTFQKNGRVFSWKATTPYPLPDWIKTD
jgi:FkbH-like protein